MTMRLPLLLLLLVNYVTTLPDVVFIENSINGVPLADEPLAEDDSTPQLETTIAIETTDNASAETTAETTTTKKPKKKIVVQPLERAVEINLPPEVIVAAKKKTVGPDEMPKPQKLVLETNDAVIEYSQLCANGTPLVMSGELYACSLTQQCPTNYWCHIGSTKKTTYCCPNTSGGNGCLESLHIGTGNGGMKRYYFNQMTRSCEEFTYSGTGGNQNNFLTQRTCVGVCTGAGAATSGRMILPTASTNRGSSGSGLVLSSPCLAPGPVPGSGSDLLTRWYFDLTTNECYPFVYFGEGGTENSFETSDDCEDTCIHEEDISALSGQLIMGNSVYANGTRRQQITLANTGGGYINPSSGYSTYISPSSGTVGYPSPGVVYPAGAGYPNVNMIPMTGSLPSGVAVSSSAIPNPCSLPLATGGCQQRQQCQQQTRYAYVGGQQACVKFDFQGQGGNLNNFGTLTECQNACGPPLVVNPTVCANTQDAGTGPYSIPRYAWNPQANSCSQFFYHGYGGNFNRFPTMTLCLQTCQQAVATTPAYVPPTVCKNGNPPSPVYCTAGVTGQCPGNFFCHVGQGIDTTLCCPAASSNPCTEAMDQGAGTAALTRYYYNQATGRCQTFLYRGLQGNQNNFLTYDRCSRACAVNPCGQGTPYATNGLSVQCSAMQQGICPERYYCHVGLDTSTTVCCPRQGENICNLPQVLGRGTGRLQRWAYNAVSRTCDAFIYTGLGGNENNFLTEADCRGQCPVYTNPCAMGEPAMAPNTQNVLYCSTASVATCPMGYYCHIGSGGESTVCCPVSGSDRCLLPLATGTGNAVLTRYYFDYGASLCKAFTYTGIRGNENNFLSLAECRAACPEYDNPCPSGTPPVNPVTGQVRFCSETNPTCEANYWCHIGANRQTSVCCPNPSNPCVQPLTLGIGTAQLPRWYYDMNSRICREYTYSGKGGNQNNFMSQAECKSACPVLENPCAGGMPATTSTGAAVLCSTANPNVCPASYWCHVGATSATTLCCPGATDPCRLPLSRGTGTSVLNRWYYNTDTKTCLSYTYTGKGGNQNNFLSLAECRLQCPEFQNPCSTGQPHIGLNGQITHCGATSPSICPTTYWCHVGGTLDSSVCCPGAGNPCELPLLTGNGQAILPRFYYDSTSQTCKSFRYTGMGGNQNNFNSQIDCEKRCPVFRNPCGSGEPARNSNNQIIPCSVSNLIGCPSGYWCHVGMDEKTTLCCPDANGNICRQPLQVGTGEAALPRHFYNALTQQCLRFTYSGVGGNQNNFLSRADCERICPVFSNPCATGDPATGPNGQYVLCSATSPNVCPANYWCHIGDLNANSVCCPGAENPCILPPATGNGNEALARWYFDTNVRRCTHFTYTGMGGNQNNFLSIQDCQLRCPEFQNPCAYGDPAQSPGGGILFCSRTARTCPSNFFCHVGLDDESTVCCPGASSPCLQSLLPGTGSAKLSRWYFSQNTRQCLSFTYTGRGGNQNNFLTEAECIASCPVFQNPCGSSMVPPQVIFCSAQTQNACPAGYWCHVGITSESSVCCPGQSDPCSMEISVGTGTGPTFLSRWYFDSAVKMCKQFQYSGVGGNQNNFLTQAACQQKCPEFSNPCLAGEPFRETSSNQVKYCNRNLPNDCPPAFWCHVGATQQTTVCCPGASDPCTLPLAIGSGPASLARWYFNTATRRCQQFTYRGLNGNRNNFMALRDCQINCPEFTNPCSVGSPLTTVSGQIQYCSQQNTNICPPDYFCHIGVTQDSTVCCPGAGDPCNLPRSVGRGSASLQRYYFDQVTRQCTSYVYTGIGGNANNFLTLTACRARCAEFENPCSGSGQPYRSPGGQALYCNANSVCPTNYYCHYGQDATTTLCCPATGDPCMQSVVIGRGIAQLTRYYYNSVLKTCISYVYSGVGGNENNFRTESECQARCQPLVNPCASGDVPLQDNTGQNRFCGTAQGAQGCPSTHYCHVGVDIWNTVCCPLNGNRCQLPLAKGYSSTSTALQRWYFNPTTQQCTLFTYAGAGGNGNNFLTRTECESQCLPQQSTGMCPQGEPLYIMIGQVQTCTAQCPQTGPCGCPPTYVCQMPSVATQTGYCCPDPRYYCIQPGDPGSLSCSTSVSIGVASQTRYGYNPMSDSCAPFSYNSCGGNLNNFNSLTGCTSQCTRRGFDKLYQLVMKHRRKVTQARRRYKPTPNITSASGSEEWRFNDASREGVESTLAELATMVNTVLNDDMSINDAHELVKAYWEAGAVQQDSPPSRSREIQSEPMAMPFVRTVWP